MMDFSPVRNEDSTKPVEKSIVGILYKNKNSDWLFSFKRGSLCYRYNLEEEKRELSDVDLALLHRFTMKCVINNGSSCTLTYKTAEVNNEHNVGNFAEITFVSGMSRLRLAFKISLVRVAGYFNRCFPYVCEGHNDYKDHEITTKLYKKYKQAYLDELMSKIDEVPPIEVNKKPFLKRKRIEAPPVVSTIVPFNTEPIRATKRYKRKPKTKVISTSNISTQTFQFQGPVTFIPHKYTNPFVSSSTIPTFNQISSLIAPRAYSRRVFLPKAPEFNGANKFLLP